MPVELKAYDFQVKDVDVKKRTLCGYAATWDLDNVGDQIRGPGAFAQTIAERGPRPDGAGKMRSKIKLLRNHRILIGTPQIMREDGVGLYTESLVDDTAEGNDTLKQIESGSLDTMSFAFDVVNFEYDSKRHVRYLDELKVYEISAVDIPANDAAKILETKGVPRSLARLLTAMTPEKFMALQEELKAGRAISAANLGKITACFEVLQQATETLGALIAAGAPPAQEEPPPAEDDAGGSGEGEKGRTPGADRSQQGTQADTIGALLCKRLEGFQIRVPA